jgi:predicted RNase H-like HicB family nuclease
MKTQQTRTQLLQALSQLVQLRPEWRLGQTLANLATTAGRLEPGGVWDLEDEEALAAAKVLIEQYTETQSAPAEAKTV